MSGCSVANRSATPTQKGTVVQAYAPANATRSQPIRKMIE
jgi:hypothetical protein